MCFNKQGVIYDCGSGFTIFSVYFFVINYIILIFFYLTAAWSRVYEYRRFFLSVFGNLRKTNKMKKKKPAKSKFEI